MSEIMRYEVNEEWASRSPPSPADVEKRGKVEGESDPLQSRKGGFRIRDVDVLEDVGV